MLIPSPVPQDARQWLDREKGKPGWIFAGGPSLLKLRREEIGPEDRVMAVNFSIWANERLGLPEADYWIFGDLAMPMNVNVMDYPGVRKWTSGWAVAYLMGRGLTLARPERGEEGRGNTLVYAGAINAESGIIRRSMPYLFWWGMTINAALHLAWVLGWNPIHLRGVDFGPDDDGRLHWYDPPGSAVDFPHAKSHLEQYQKCQRSTSWMIHAMRTLDNRTVTVESASWLLDGPIANDPPKEG